MVAKHSFLNKRISFDDKRKTTKLFSFAKILADVPAERIIWPPFPGINSTLWTSVPKGISFKGKAFPTEIGEFIPALILSPILSVSGCKIYLLSPSS